MIYRRAAKDAETDFPFAVDLPSLKLWQGKDAGKGKPISPVDLEVIVFRCSHPTD
jgi:hypothetical protein